MKTQKVIDGIRDYLEHAIDIFTMAIFLLLFLVGLYAIIDVNKVNASAKLGEQITEYAKADDEEAAPNASARRKALLAKLNAVCAPAQTVAPKVVVAETAEDRDSRCKAVYGNFDALLADFIKRK